MDGPDLAADGGMRPVLTLAVVACALVSACGVRPHPYPAVEPYLLHVPAPGTDYRYRTGPQGFGRVGPVLPPEAAYPDYPGYPHPASGWDGYGAYGHGGHHAYGPGDPEVYAHGRAWSEHRRSASGGYSYERRESATLESRFHSGVTVERLEPREPHRPGARPYEPDHGPVPYGPAPYDPAPYDPAPYGPTPYESLPPEWPGYGPVPYDAGDEGFY